VSPDNKFASFGIDIVGRRIYTIQIKNLETGEILSDKIENATKLRLKQITIFLPTRQNYYNLIKFLFNALRYYR
jgi:protease II